MLRIKNWNQNKIPNDKHIYYWIPISEMKSRSFKLLNWQIELRAYVCYLWRQSAMLLSITQRVNENFTAHYLPFKQRKAICKLLFKNIYRYTKNFGYARFYCFLPPWHETSDQAINLVWQQDIIIKIQSVLTKIVIQRASIPAFHY